ncbi:uncharacterized protein PAC_08197 [Phialocephala subalpina]|uniref:Cyanovirin-N domain-containing protein n=1 Tax=Phialocephala subalpina TaxID=576137 RepID=A0A1L7WZV3_9HELO|nr:uncharacterized protein PAC_08197 [Phialocephala subalpina]
MHIAILLVSFLLAHFTFADVCPGYALAFISLPRGGDHRYHCEPYTNAGYCATIAPDPTGVLSKNHKNGFSIESCCRNDPKRNLAEGLISEREYQAIEETNAMLDIHLRDYEAAVASGMNAGNLTALHDVQKRELKDAEARQLEARWLDIDLAKS